ncbi:IQ domain-containing protein E-like isoform X2 [Dreissena polymorpha]|uniref:IQ domain-containing protein E-like isoform X2 n=1 Tax=Dreissena polymorpha TaxID=45954 RepID=UPI0022654993|nr:IQ domain-containing protein E-like isoform X2 [Dreissena polymorpha]
MPGKEKSHDSEDLKCTDLENADTLIGRNSVPKPPTKKKSRRPSSATDRKPRSTPRRPVTPGKRKKRPQSAPSHRTGHDLWMSAVKHRRTVGLSGSHHPGSPHYKTSNEYWIDTLRRTGTGFTTESIGMNTFGGKRPRDKDMPYLSTSAYLRQMAGSEKPSKQADAMARANPGTPAYKSQEEYYEQILEYKKQVSSLNQDSATMKAKIRRLEEDNLKKEKEIESLLHPHKSEELRLTLADKRPDSGAMIHSLKQKILKLETQMRDKETSYIKLQSDLKTTKIDEMKQQMEVFYNEIVRLQNSKETGVDKSARAPSREGSVKVKALNETILRLNKHNEQLQGENRGLKEDLKRFMDQEQDELTTHKDCKDMDRKELLRFISQLEKKLQRAEEKIETGSLGSPSTHSKMQGKIALEGNTAARLDQLDKRESELLDTLERKNERIKDLTEERDRWKQRCDELEILLSHGSEQHPSPKARPEARRPPSARSGSRVKDTSTHDPSEQATPRTPTHRPPTAGSQRPSTAGSQRPPSAKRRSSLDSSVSSVRKKKIEAFKENRSAKVIQRNWRSHQNKEQKAQNERVNKFREKHAAKIIQRGWTKHCHDKIEHEREEAADLIRSSLLGHRNRQQQMSRRHDDDDDDYETDNEDYNNCVALIQSAMKGHNTRKNNMRDYAFSSTGEEDDEDEVMSSASRLRASSRSSRPQSPAAHRQRPQSPAPHGQRPQSGRSRTSLSGSVKSTGSSSGRQQYSSSHVGHDDDDDDF